MDEIISSINTSFKLFWDGSISLFNDTAHSSTNNKVIINALLAMRNQTDIDSEPPVTLLHGDDTEKTVREAIIRIKIDQQEEMEAEKLRLQQEGADEEESDNMDDLAESRADLSTFAEDMDNIADFQVFRATPFTTKLLQGVAIKALYSFDEHTKPTDN